MSLQEIAAHLVSPRSDLQTARGLGLTEEQDTAGYQFQCKTDSHDSTTWTSVTIDGQAVLQELTVLIDGVVDGGPRNWETSDRGCIEYRRRNIVGEGRGGPLSTTAPAASLFGRETIVRGVTTDCLDAVLAVQVRPAWSVHTGLATPFAGNFHKAGRTLSTAAAIELEASWQGQEPLCTAIPSCQREFVFVAPQLRTMDQVHCRGHGET